jgi:hypothetical protein
VKLPPVDSESYFRFLQIPKTHQFLEFFLLAFLKSGIVEDCLILISTLSESCDKAKYPILLQSQIELILYENLPRDLSKKDILQVHLQVRHLSNWIITNAAAQSDLFKCSHKSENISFTVKSDYLSSELIIAM